MDERAIKETLDFLKLLPEGRRIFFNTGILMIEVSKEEAIKKLEDMLTQQKKEGKNNDKK